MPPGGKMATSLLLLVRAQVRPGTRSDECCAASYAGESTLHFFAGLAQAQCTEKLSAQPSI